MSKYFQALNRISQQAKAPLPADSEKPRKQSEQRSETAEKVPQQEPLLHISPFGNMPSVRRERAYSELLDSLRAISGRSGVPSTVLAGVSRSLSAKRVMKGLRDQSKEQGVRLLSLELAMDGSRRFLRETSWDDTEGHDDRHPSVLSDQQVHEQFAQTPGSATNQIEEWLHGVDKKFDLLAIQAPPLTDSVEAALLARETDGLILIVENLVDSHADLEAAIDRARDADCALLGVVLFGAEEWLPKWLRRLFRGRGPLVGKKA